MMHRALFTFPLVSAIATTLFSFPVQAQSCAGLFQRPVDKERLNAIAASVGIVNSDGISRVENTFEAFALGTISGLPFTPVQPNKDPEQKFPSPARDRITNGKYKNVIPDGLLPLVVYRSPIDIRTYPNSVFYEVKAVKDDHLAPSGGSGPYQILGFIDAARRSTDAGKLGEIPAVVFLTTSDVVQLSFDTRTIAYAAGVAILHSIPCESRISGAASGNLQLGPAEVLTREVYLDTGVTPGTVGPGARSRLQNFRVGQ